jgi:hypothetical protein
VETSSAPVVDPDDKDKGGGHIGLWILLGLVLGAAAGYGVARLVGGGRHDDVPAPAAARVPAGPSGWSDVDYREIAGAGGEAAWAQTRPMAPVGGRGLATGAPTRVDPAVTRAAQERDRLVRACIDVSDRLQDTDRGLWRRLNAELADVGVEVVAPSEGDPFDPNLQEATGSEPTTDPGRHMTVASTEFTGFTDHGKVLRRPAVVVFRADQVPR